MGWTNNLDMLAQNGVIDFDAPAYIMGQAPRYVGNPVAPNPFNGNPPSIANLQQPYDDEFKPTSKNTPQNIQKTSTWKKWLFGALAIGGLIFGGVKFKSKIVPWFKKKVNNFSFKSIKKFVVDKAKVVGNFFKNCWNKFTGLFKKKTK